mmetsp:Transcript_32393/g.58887  ORF Transcript_32393/g.58887 Transcript_32393/m.58887 type:complete len:202 (+) Transcript_32393:652-1257(+)
MLGGSRMGTPGPSKNRKPLSCRSNKNLMKPPSWPLSGKPRTARRTRRCSKAVIMAGSSSNRRPSTSVCLRVSLKGVSSTQRMRQPATASRTFIRMRWALPSRVAVSRHASSTLRSSRPAKANFPIRSSRPRYGSCSGASLEGADGLAPGMSRSISSTSAISSTLCSAKSASVAAARFCMETSETSSATRVLKACLTFAPAP